MRKSRLHQQFVHTYFLSNIFRFAIFTAILFGAFCTLGKAQSVLFQLPDTTADNGENLALDLTTERFEEIVSVQFSINWDASVIQYQSFGLTDLENVAIGATDADEGVLRLSWFALDGIPKTLPDGSSIVRLNFTAIGMEGDSTGLLITDNPLPVQIARATDMPGIFEPIDMEQDTGSVKIFSEEPLFVEATFTSEDVSCFELNDGLINATISTNIDPLTYSWSGPNMFTSSEEDVSNLEAGDYQLVITDTEGTIFLDTTLTISQPEMALAIASITTDTSACDAPTGTAEVAATGGTAPYTFDIGNGPVDEPLLEQLSSGDYDLTITDANGCAVEDNFTIPSPPAPELDLGSNINVCEGETVTLTAGDYQGYSWSTGESTSSIEVTENGTYGLTVTNAFNCEATDEVEVSFTDNFEITVEDDQLGVCPGDSVQLQVSAGDAFEWVDPTGTLNDPELPNPFASPTEATVYTVIATSECGNDTATISVDIYPVPEVDLGEDQSLCELGSTELDAGNFATYAWSTGATTATITAEETGTYAVTVTNDQGCQGTDTVNLTFSEGFELVIENDFLEVCPGDSIELLVSGGDVYQWADTSGTLSSLTIANPMASPQFPTAYTVVASNDCGTDMATLVVELLTTEAYAGPDTCVAVDTEAQLLAFGGVEYEWIETPYPVSDVKSPDPTTMPEDSATYVVSITDAGGCTTVDSMTVFVANNVEFINAVNMITPNGDGKNDVLEFRGLNKFNLNSLKVYNRWGDLVYQKVNYQLDAERWDGTKNGQPLPAGNYFYVLSLRSGEIKQTLTIVRE